MSMRRINVDLLAGGQEHHFVLVNDHLWPSKALALVEQDARVLAAELSKWLTPHLGVPVGYSEIKSLIERVQEVDSSLAIEVHDLMHRVETNGARNDL